MKVAPASNYHHISETSFSLMLHFLVLTTRKIFKAVLFYRDTSIKNNIFHNFGILITIHLLENGKQTSFNLKDSAKSAWGLNPKRFSSMRFTSCIFYLIRKSGYRRRSLKKFTKSNGQPCVPKGN